MRLRLALLLVAAAAAPASAAGTSGASFLLITPTAASPVAEIPAEQEDGSSAGLNPAALARADRKLMTTAYSAYLVDSTLNYAAYVHPMPSATAAFSFLRLGTGGIEGRNSARAASGDFGASDTALGVAYARGPAGLQLKYIRQEIARYSAQGFAADLGLYKTLHAFRPLGLGFSVRNAGPDMKFVGASFKLPTTVNASLSVPIAGFFGLSAGFSRRIHDRDDSFSIGTHYGIGEALTLRAGYGFTSGQDFGERPLPAMGFGLKVASQRLDYSYAPFRDLGGIHRFSLAFRFGKERNAAPDSGFIWRSPGQSASPATKPPLK